MRVPIEIRPCNDPAGRRAVLMQFPDSYLIMPPKDVRMFCAELLNCADEVEAGG